MKEQVVQEQRDTEVKVQVSINGKQYEIPAGNIKVVRLKQLAGIPAADELAEIREGKLFPLPDDGQADVKQCDVFVSYPRSCSAS